MHFCLSYLKLCIDYSWQKSESLFLRGSIYPNIVLPNPIHISLHCFYNIYLVCLAGRVQGCCALLHPFLAVSSYVPFIGY